MKQFAGTNNGQLKVVGHLIAFIFVIVFKATTCDGHGRLIEPPSRASAWRYGFNTPPDYNDHELYCGGFTRQWKHNDGKCGECGDAWDLPQPRPHEHGGQWGQGVIVRRYAPGAEMMIRVELTASHMGYFEFRLCPEPKAKQDCLDRYLLNIIGGSPSQPAPGDIETRFYPRNGSRIYEIKTQLPDITCTQCVLQWRYVAGNNWGMCPDGTHGAVGCGPQEEFRSCSDIALGEGQLTPMRPIRPTIRPTHRPKIPSSSTESPQQDTSSESFNYVPLLVIFLLLLLALCIFALWYLKRRNNKFLAECKEYFDNRLCKKKTPIAATPKRATLPSIISRPALGSSQKLGSEHLPPPVNTPVSVPVPPPRTKRQTRVKDMTPDESSIA